MMLKGMTVEYLLHRTFKVQKGMNVLIHAAAGGIGLIACQWANQLGANVIGTVGSKDKAELAKANGCHHTILYRDEDFVAKVKEITGGKLCEVVYDGVGKATFPASLDCIKPLGMFVSFGNRVGLDRGVQHQHPAAQGLAVRHPPDAQHLRRQARGPASIANDLFDVVASGKVKIPINQKYALKDAAEGAPGPRRPQHHRLDHPGALIAVSLDAHARSAWPQPRRCGHAVSVAPLSGVAADVSDAEVMAIVRKHCVTCHAKAPTHPAFDKPPQERRRWRRSTSSRPRPPRWSSRSCSTATCRSATRPT